jgi:hypothetical protein
MAMVLSTLLNLKSWQVDYTQAFPQAPLDNDVFMRIPQGWYFDPSTKQLHQDTSDPCSVDKEHYIRLKRNLYGVKQAARNWYLLSRKVLLDAVLPNPRSIHVCLFAAIALSCCILMTASSLRKTMLRSTTFANRSLPNSSSKMRATLKTFWASRLITILLPMEQS